MATRFFRAAANFSTRLPRAGIAAAAAAITLSSGALAFTDKAPAATPATPYWGKPGTPAERTFIALKPDAVQRGLIGEIIRRFEAKGYKLVAIKMLTPTLEQAQAHYSDLSTKPFFPGLCKFFSSGPVVAMVWEGQGAILGGRRLLGTTNPNDSAPGSIRGDFAVVTGRNIIHGSDGPESAEAEIKHWFTAAEVNDWKSIEAAWVYEKTA